MTGQAMAMRGAPHPNCATIAGQGSSMRIWLLLLIALPACSTFDAGPPPVPATTIAAPSAAVPPDPEIRPLTEDQRAMLDG